MNSMSCITCFFDIFIYGSKNSVLVIMISWKRNGVALRNTVKRANELKMLGMLEILAIKNFIIFLQEESKMIFIKFVGEFLCIKYHLINI